MSIGLRGSTNTLNCTGAITARFGTRGGKTTLLDSSHRAPLKIAKAFPQGDGQLSLYTMDSSPGLMDGDEYRLDLQLEQDARVYVTNQSYTKVHPSLGKPSRQHQRIRIASGAVLEYMPEPVMLYRDADFASETDVEIAAGGALVMGEVFSAGRVARGEKFRFRRYLNTVRVVYNEELVYYNRQIINPVGLPLTTAGSWGTFTHLGALYIFSDQMNREHMEVLRDVLHRHPRLFGGISLADKNGALVFAMGERAWELERLFASLWGETRRLLFGLGPLNVRK